MKKWAPRLEMLWEGDDPGDVLSTRFGFGDAGAVGDWVAATIEEHWGLELTSCDRVVMSHHNALAWIGTDSGPLVAKWSVDPRQFARLAALARLTGWLGERGHPVSAPLVTADGRLQVDVEGRASMFLQRQIDGELLDVGDPEQVRATGATLARLHSALAAYPSGRDFASSPVEDLATRIGGWLASPHSANLADDTREAMQDLLAPAPREPLAPQLVHGDIRSANVLVADQDVAAVLDFEQAGFEFPVVELARASVLLGTRFREWGPVSPDVHARLVAGYESERPLTATERAWLGVLVPWISLLMVPSGDDPTGWGPAAIRLLARPDQDDSEES